MYKRQGLYQSKDERIQVVKKNGLRIAFLTYNQMLNTTEDYPDYCIHDFNEEQMKKDVENAREISDIIIAVSYTHLDVYKRQAKIQN